MASDKIIYSMVRCGKVYPPGKRVLENISLGYFLGAKIGVIGDNGSGKTTLLRIMAGVEEEFEGEAALSPGYTVGYLEQEPVLDDEKTVAEAVEEGFGEVSRAVREYERICEEMSDPDADMEALIERQAGLQEIIEEADAWDLDSRIEQAASALRCPPGDMKVGLVSGGERRRIALARLLLSRPDILLLDEPTNHLDAETVAWLEHHLHEYPGTVIAVTHDRYFLDNVAGWILELDRGRGIPFKGNYTSWLEQKNERLRVEAKGSSERKKTIEKELEWVRTSPKGRQAKSKARVSRYEELIENQPRDLPRDLEIYIPPGPRLGRDVVIFDGVMKAYGEKLLYEDLSFQIPPGAIIGVIGANGSGKTTIFRMITGEEKPDSGTIRTGSTVKFAYVDQSREDLDPEKTVFEEISGGAAVLELGKVRMNPRVYVGRFNFSGSDQEKRVGSLSGGERNRVHLAKVVKSGGNLILLDEPTNDLDVGAIRALEEALAVYAGSAMIISHDRWFLDRVATHILALEGDSSWRWWEGNYSSYEEDRRKRLGAGDGIPGRIKYRKLAR